MSHCQTTVALMLMLCYSSVCSSMNVYYNKYFVQLSVKSVSCWEESPLSRSLKELLDVSDCVVQEVGDLLSLATILLSPTSCPGASLRTELAFLINLYSLLSAVEMQLHRQTTPSKMALFLSCTHALVLPGNQSGLMIILISWQWMVLSPMQRLKGGYSNAKKIWAFFLQLEVTSRWLLTISRDPAEWYCGLRETTDRVQPSLAKYLLYCSKILVFVDLELRCVFIHSCADAVFHLLPALGQGPLHSCLPCLQWPLLLHTHTGSSHCWFLAWKVQVSLILKYI